jgi:hypothetical protein
MRTESINEETRPRGESAAGLLDSSAVASRRADENSGVEGRHVGKRDNVGRITNPRCIVYPMAASKGGPHGYEQITTTKS